MAGVHVQLPVPGISRWLGEARRSWRGDVLAGLTLWGLVVPESVAYSGLAGAPVSAGIWAVVLILPVYAIWGYSRHLVASPTSAAAVTVGGVVATMSGVEPAQAVGAVTIAVGVVFLLAYVLRLGFVVNFISVPINAGFMFGLSLFIAISQLGKVFGIHTGEGNAIERLTTLVAHLGQTNWVTVVLSVGCFAILVGLPRLSSRLPAGLIMVVAAGVVTATLRLHEREGVATPEAIPGGLPDFGLPELSGSLWGTALVGAVGLVLLGFSEAASVARDLAEKAGHEYPAERDLFPFGLGNLISGFAGGLVGAGSLSSTSTNVSAGAKTPISTLTAAAAALVTVLFFGGAVADLPEAALGVLIIHAVSRHISLAAYREIARSSQAEAAIAAVAAAGVLVFDVLWGLVIAMAASLVWFVRRATSNQVWVVGPNRIDPSVLERTGEEGYTPLPDGVLGLRVGGQLFYGNIAGACESIRDDVRAGPPGGGRYHALVLDLQGQVMLDYTSAQDVAKMTRGLIDREGVTVVLVGVEPEVGAMLKAGDLPEGVVVLRTTNLAPVMGRLADNQPGHP